MATRLPPLTEIQRLSPRVIRILGGNPNKFTLQGTNTYLLGTGPTRFLLDSGQGFPSWKTHLSSVLKDEAATVSHVFLTHWHQDHVDGVPDLQSLCPDAKVYKSHNGRNSTALNAKPEEMSWFDIPDGQKFTTDGAGITAIRCLGHTTDHTAFYLAEEDALFTGDNVLGHGTAVFEDLSTYMASLDKMRDRAAPGKRAYPGHGEVIEDGRAKIEEYIAHRKEREREVLAALQADGGAAKTAMEIVKIVYSGYPESLYEAAKGGVLQILQKLEKEGAVQRVDGDSDKWIARTTEPRSIL